ncbi:MAG TPA: hypothetical protein PK289_00010 [Bacteroidia bacterium]|nr:hypothetical protein [Bacteroidia bacterium]
MEKKTKIILGGTGGLLLAAGLAIGIYQLTKSKVVTSGNTGGNAGPGTAPPPPPANSAEEKMLAALNLLLKGYELLKNFVAESFPLRAGMKGENVKKMQQALVNKFNQLKVKQDGIFGVETFKALQAIGYASVIDNTISQEEFNNIIAGIRK